MKLLLSILLLCGCASAASAAWRTWDGTNFTTRSVAAILQDLYLGIGERAEATKGFGSPFDSFSASVPTWGEEESVPYRTNALAQFRTFRLDLTNGVEIVTQVVVQAEAVFTNCPFGSVTTAPMFATPAAFNVIAGQYYAGVPILRQFDNLLYRLSACYADRSLLSTGQTWAAWLKVNRTSLTNYYLNAGTTPVWRWTNLLAVAHAGRVEGAQGHLRFGLGAGIVVAESHCQGASWSDQPVAFIQPGWRFDTNLPVIRYSAWCGTNSSASLDVSIAGTYRTLTNAEVHLLGTGTVSVASNSVAAADRLWDPGAVTVTVSQASAPGDAVSVVYTSPFEIFYGDPSGTTWDITTVTADALADRFRVCDQLQDLLIWGATRGAVGNAWMSGGSGWSDVSFAAAESNIYPWFVADPLLPHGAFGGIVTWHGLGEAGHYAWAFTVETNRVYLSACSTNVSMSRTLLVYASAPDTSPWPDGGSPSPTREWDANGSGLSQDDWTSYTLAPTSTYHDVYYHAQEPGVWPSGPTVTNTSIIRGFDIPLPVWEVRTPVFDHTTH